MKTGIGGICSDGSYFQNKWSDIDLSNPEIRDIQWRELVAVYVILEHSKERFKNSTIWIWCDNMSVVRWISKLRSKFRRPDCQVIINRIAEILYHYFIKIWIEHIPGEDNIYADALSRYYTISWKDAPFPITNPINTTSQLQEASNLSKNIRVKENMFVGKTHNDHPLNINHVFIFGCVSIITNFPCRYSHNHYELNIYYHFHHYNWLLSL